MKFNGNDVSLSSHSEGITIKMKNGTGEAILFLSNKEGTQLLSFLLSAYGVSYIVDENSEEEVIPDKDMRH